ncbi:MAG: hypothetical protein R3297_03600 [Desulfobulbales bacterium]|nr:hypothetical protein [Desulfobulbales bacterium]
MKKPGIIIIVLIIVFALPHLSEAKRKNHYRTYEVIAITENGLTMQDNDGNIIAVNKSSQGYRVGYKVRYDSVRKRLRRYRWQEYKVNAVYGDNIILEHKTGDIISVPGNYAGKYNIGDIVRYDSVGEKLRAVEKSGQWQQYTVIGSTADKVTLESNAGQHIILSMNNNIFSDRRGAFVAKYKVGDKVRYNAATNKLKKGGLRSYDWRYYTIKDVTAAELVLISDNLAELSLKNTYGTRFKAGDRVRYDRLNNLLKKVR